VTAESATLVRVEDDFDEVYSRYGGRQIVRRGEARAPELAAGSLFVPLEGEAAVRAALVLEPARSTASTSPRVSRRSPERTAPSGPARRGEEGRDAVTGNAAALAALLAEEVPPVDHVDLFLVRLPFVSPFAISTASGPRRTPCSSGSSPAASRRGASAWPIPIPSTRTRRRARPGTS
jgi:hypothetical protein